jgi:hypothetical protein
MASHDGAVDAISRDASTTGTAPFLRRGNLVELQLAVDVKL